jgi:site-specific recombinase XerD
MSKTQHFTPHRGIRSDADPVCPYLDRVRSSLQELRYAPDTIRHLVAVANTPAVQWLNAFDAHLAQVQGLAPASRRRYCFYVRRFLESFCGASEPDWSSLRSEHLGAFIQQEASRLHRNAIKGPSTAIRTLLRYLVFKGDIRPGLEAAIPTMRQWKHAALPARLAPESIERILASAGRDGDAGLRSRAVIMLLARLGLRASEVIQLALEDIDWVEGTILIRAGKSRRERRLPLTQEVGAAVSAYLELGRPRSAHRTVFLTLNTPFGPIRDASIVAKIARRAMAEAGVAMPSAAAHALRHAAATQMVCSGAAFKDIADVLGHAAVETTAIYAKLDLATLSRVALPWPGSTS